MEYKYNHPKAIDLSIAKREDLRICPPLLTLPMKICLV
jgi:hypothetical protein